ncbi:MAG: 50S ribosomal protein L9 [Acidobacteriota bacterium]
MRILLKETVDNLGKAGELVEVANGYARNFLLPKGLALTATPGNLKNFEAWRKRREVLKLKEKEAAEALAQKMTRIPLQLAHRAGDTETIYGAVTSAEIAYALEEKGIEIDRRCIRLENPIKSLGTYHVAVKLHPEVTAQLTVDVIREEV